MKIVRYLYLFFFFIIISGCFPYVYYDQSEVLIKGVDIPQTLDIALFELNRGGFGSALTIWAIRDQIISKEDALRINKIYFDYIDKVDEFDKWHFAWAISNLYRNGDDEVKNELQTAYLSAKKIPETLKNYGKIADLHINGDKIYMGDVHSLGRAYSRNHIVVPGNKNYLQSYEEFVEKHSENKK